jgi:plastocyanin
MPGRRLLVSSTLLVAALAPLAADATAADHPVAVTSNVFTPATVTIDAGDTVTWTNTEGSHNVRFDDGSFEDPPNPAGNGWTAQRTFNAPGTFRYYCEQHGDAGGVGMSGTVTVREPGSGGPAPGGSPGGSGPGGGGPSGTGGDRTAPAVSRVALTRKRFRVAPRTGRARRAGTTFTFSLSEPARVRIAISRAVKRRGRTRYVAAGALPRRGLKGGANRVSFSGRIGRRALAPGAYRATISATDGAGNTSSPRRLAFRVVRG